MCNRKVSRVQSGTFPLSGLRHHALGVKLQNHGKSPPLYARTLWSRSPPLTCTRAGVTTDASLVGAAGSTQQFVSRLASRHLLPGGDELIRSLPFSPHPLYFSLPHTQFTTVVTRTPTHARTYNTRCAGLPAHERCFWTANVGSFCRSTQWRFEANCRATFTLSCGLIRIFPPGYCFIQLLVVLKLIWPVRTHLQTEPRRWRVEEDLTGANR